MHRSLLALFAAALPTAALAQDITGASVDPTTGEIEILGTGLSTNHEARMAIDGVATALVIHSTTPTAILASVPSTVALPLPEGTWKLAIGTSSHGFFSSADELDVAVAAPAAAPEVALVARTTGSVSTTLGTTTKVACSVELTPKQRLTDQVVVMHGTVTARISGADGRVGATAMVRRDGVLHKAGLTSETFVLREQPAALPVLGVHTLAACAKGCRDTLELHVQGPIGATLSASCQLVPIVMEPAATAL